MDNSERPQDAYLYFKPTNLPYDNRRKAILECIRRYPHHTEKWIADVMTLNRICSRKTTKGVIKDLLSDRQIEDKKMGNSFHCYNVNHEDEYIQFSAAIKEFRGIQDEMMEYYSKTMEHLHNDSDSETIEHLRDECICKLDMLKLASVDILCAFLHIFHQMVHKYSHVASGEIASDFLGAIEVLGSSRMEDCLDWMDRSLRWVTDHDEFKPVEKYCESKGMQYQPLYHRLIKLKEDLRDLYDNNRIEEIEQVELTPFQKGLDQSI